VDGAGAGAGAAGDAFFLRREIPFSRLTSSTCGTSTALVGSFASCDPIV
jgi:hypothetical protein